MRPVLHGDICAAARALLAAPRASRHRLCTRMIAEAELADQHVKATGQLHPVYGNGALMTVARSRALADEPGFDDLQYCQCFALVLSALIRFHTSRKRS